MVLGKKLLHFFFPINLKSDNNSRLPGKNVWFSFRLLYPLANQVEWKQIDVSKWQVTYKIKNNICWGLYTSDGSWLETIHAVSFKDIPKKIQESYQLSYAINSLKDANKVQTPIRIIFEIRCTSKAFDLRLLYNEEGKLVSKIIL